MPTQHIWRAIALTDISLVTQNIAPALHTGYDRAKTEADKIKQFWA